MTYRNAIICQVSSSVWCCIVEEPGYVYLMFVVLDGWKLKEPPFSRKTFNKPSSNASFSLLPLKSSFLLHLDLCLQKLLAETTYCPNFVNKRLRIQFYLNLLLHYLMTPLGFLPFIGFFLEKIPILLMSSSVGMLMSPWFIPCPFLFRFRWFRVSVSRMLSASKN